MFSNNHIYKTFFYKKSNTIKKSLFFICDDNYWYTNQKSFGSVFEIIAIELGVIDFNKLQNDETERIKLNILEQAKRLGNFMLNDYKNKYFKKGFKMKEFYRNNFFLTRDSALDFIHFIIRPLINLINNKHTYNWIRLENEKGVWREIKCDETISTRLDVVVDFKMGKKYIRL